MAIPQTFDEAFERAKQLVSTFKDNESKYLAPGYSEAQARLDFIDTRLIDQMLEAKKQFVRAH